MYQVISQSILFPLTDEKPRVLFVENTFKDARARLEAIKFHRAVRDWDMSDRGRCLTVATKDGQHKVFRIVKK